MKVRYTLRRLTTMAFVIPTVLCAILPIVHSKGFSSTLLETKAGKTDPLDIYSTDMEIENHTALHVIQIMNCDSKIIGSGLLMGRNSFLTASQLIPKTCFIKTQRLFDEKPRFITAIDPKGPFISLASFHPQIHVKFPDRPYDFCLVADTTRTALIGWKMDGTPARAEAVLMGTGNDMLKAQLFYANHTYAVRLGDVLTQGGEVAGILIGSSIAGDRIFGYFGYPLLL